MGQILLWMCANERSNITGAWPMQTGTMKKTYKKPQINIQTTKRWERESEEKTQCSWNLTFVIFCIYPTPLLRTLAYLFGKVCIVIRNNNKINIFLALFCVLNGLFFRSFFAGARAHCLKQISIWRIGEVWLSVFDAFMSIFTMKNDQAFCFRSPSVTFRSLSLLNWRSLLDVFVYVDLSEPQPHYQQWK